MQSSGSINEIRNGSDLPPKRHGKAVRTDVQKPLQSTRLSKLINILVSLSVLLSAFYAYRLMQYKTHIGGWWNLALGRFPASHGTYGGHGGHGVDGGSSGGNDGSLEYHISAVADILSLQPVDVASVLSEAVRQNVAPKSISSIYSSISSSASATGSDPTITSVLFGNDERDSEEFQYKRTEQDSKDESMLGKAGTLAKAVMGADNEPELVG